MIFRVFMRGQNIKYKANEVCLIQDEWDDFGFKTLFEISYCDKYLNSINLDYIHIGYSGMEPEPTYRKIEKSFTTISEGFFSLGASEKYYERLKILDEDSRIEILKCLNDLAFNLRLFNKYINENVIRLSFLRGITYTTVKNQFHRISKGGAVLTHYKFSYSFPGDAVRGNENVVSIDFNVIPDSNPPTNIHVLIGRNGTGKTVLLKSMIKSYFSIKEKNMEYLNTLRMMLMEG